LRDEAAELRRKGETELRSIGKSVDFPLTIIFHLLFFIFYFLFAIAEVHPIEEIANDK
jgi:hypothetical protein